MPAVRLDVGYLTNEGDARRLADPAFRDTVADAVVVAIQRLYLGEEDMSMTGVLDLADVLAQAGRQP
jgi:N-acetylmuramoyl-L-alanine amidase